MSVIIQNMSESKGLSYGSGKQFYHLKINYTKKAEFYHNFEDGLAVCLRKAADALEEEEKEDNE